MAVVWAWAFRPSPPRVGGALGGGGRCWLRRWRRALVVATTSQPFSPSTLLLAPQAEYYAEQTDLYAGDGGGEADSKRDTLTGANGMPLYSQPHANRKTGSADV